MKKYVFFIFFVFAFIFASNINAQSYNSALGAKFGYGIFGTYKKSLKENWYVDFYAGLRKSNVWGGATLQIHNSFEDIDYLYWYAGGGAYFGSHIVINNTYLFAGFNATLGIDYAFEEIPINISFDWTPGINVMGENKGIYIFAGGLALRYIIEQN